MEFSIVVAMTQGRGIGFQNQLPWTKNEGRSDMEHFRKITQNENSYVVMGRKTWETLGQPLKGRNNVVISKTKVQHDGGIILINDFQQLFNIVPKDAKIFIIGGQQLYEHAIKHPFCKNIYLTEFNFEKECDTFFPKIPLHFKLKEKTEFINGVFQTFVNNIDKTSLENQYLQLLNNILTKGEEKMDRTGTGTLSTFGHQMRFSLEDDVIPLLTTKKVYWKGVIEELLFFLRGDHDNRKLQEKGVHIWDGNTSREFLDSNSLKLETHDLGKAYGVQWRASGASLRSIGESYLGDGVDQLKEVIYLLRNEPNSRRIIINAWNVPELSEMALPPCHMMYQFYVSEEKYLSCMMTQRSADTFLGLPFNIASTATLVHILARVCNLQTGEIIINLGDAHLYESHITQAQIQLLRKPHVFPKLKINKDLTYITDIENLTYNDFETIDYRHHPSIKASMVV